MTTLVIVLLGRVIKSVFSHHSTQIAIPTRSYLYELAQFKL